MKYFIFYRENNKFDDILSDINIKRCITLKLLWCQHLMIGIGEKGNDRHYSYITLKYGDDFKKLDVPDRSPIPNIDYIPKEDKNKFKKKMQ